MPREGEVLRRELSGHGGGPSPSLDQEEGAGMEVRDGVQQELCCQGEREVRPSLG